MKLILLGSSSLLLQKGLSESLTGRFQLQKVLHWNLQESFKGYEISFEQFLLFGGYPGSYRFINDLSRWLSYMKDSIIDTVVGRDILLQARVKSPSLYFVEYDADIKSSQKGRSFEIVVGAALARLSGELFYWREKNIDVDYVYKFGSKIFAIEVKYSKESKHTGLSKFREKYPKALAFIVTPENFQQVLSEINQT